MIQFDEHIFQMGWNHLLERCSKFWGSNVLLGIIIFYAHPYFLGFVCVGGDSLQIVPFLATIWEKIFWYFFSAFYANPSIGFPRDWYILPIFSIFSTNRLFNSWGSYCNTKGPGSDRRLRTGLLGNSRALKELLERSGQSVAAVLSRLPLLCSPSTTKKLPADVATVIVADLEDPDGTKLTDGWSTISRELAEAPGTNCWWRVSCMFHFVPSILLVTVSHVPHVPGQFPTISGPPRCASNAAWRHCFVKISVPKIFADHPLRKKVPKTTLQQKNSQEKPRVRQISANPSK